MIQNAAWSPPEPEGAWKLPAANGIATRNSRVLTVQLAVVAMGTGADRGLGVIALALEETSPGARRRRTSPPTSAVKVFEVLQGDAPAERDLADGGDDQRPALGHHRELGEDERQRHPPQLAPLMASRESPASDRIPMISQIPISEPTANSRLAS